MREGGCNASVQEDVTRHGYATQLEAFPQARRAVCCGGLPRNLQLIGLKVRDGRKAAVGGSCGSGGADLKESSECDTR